MTRADTADVHRRLLAILGEAGQPLPTPEILVRMADQGHRCNGPHGGQCRDWPGRSGGFYDHCPAWCWTTPGPRGTPVYPQLRALERRGLIERVHHPNAESITAAVAAGKLTEHLESAQSGCVYWFLADTESDDYFNAAVDNNAQEASA